jgi:FKBP-type peptidyl-prolyl cis-trans isomerase
MRHFKYFSLLFVAGLLGFAATSCKDPENEFEEQEAALIREYLAKNPTINFEAKESGLYYYEGVTGTGMSPVTGDTAWVFYTLYLLTGRMIESNVGTTDTLSYVVDKGILIPGFDEGVMYMKTGGKSLLLMPSRLAYGANGTYFIPGYTPLLFDVHLVKVRRGTK